MYLRIISLLFNYPCRTVLFFPFFVIINNNIIIICIHDIVYTFNDSMMYYEFRATVRDCFLLVLDLLLRVAAWGMVKNI